MANNDPTSHYYIHPSDAHTLQLVSVKFNGDGFHSWKRSMILTLSTKNKLGFVDGSIDVPDITTAEYKCWERCNNLVITWLLYNLDETIAKSVQYFPTARELWEDLEDRYGCTSISQVYALEQQLFELTQGSDSVSVFFTKMKTLWEGLNDASPLLYCTCNKCTCGLSQRLVLKQQEQRILQFMMRLTEAFSLVRSNVLMMQPLPNISQVYRLFAQEEKHKSIASGSTSTVPAESLAFYADNKKYNPQNSSQRFNSNYQKSTGSRNTADPSKKKYFCNHCKIPGHSIERCFKIHGYPPGFQAKQQQQHQRKGFAAMAQQDSADDAPDNSNDTVSMEQYNHLLKLLSQQNIQPDSDNDNPKLAMLAGNFCLLAGMSHQWILDSGSTDHICPNLDSFISYDIVDDKDSFITIPDGTKVQVTHIGTVKVNDDLTLHKVLYVPQFQFRLISVNKLCADLKCNIIFSDDQCFIQGHSLKRPQILLGRLSGGLYCVQNTITTQNQDQSKFCHTAVSKDVEDTRLWHLRMGHLPFSKLQLLLPLKSVQDCVNTTVCQICPAARQVRKSFPSSYIKSTKPFALLHLDIWGPYKTPSHSGCTQFLTIVDDFTRFTWVHLLKSKSQVYDVLINFLAYVENQFKTTVLSIRSDNALELSAGLVAQLCKTKGILQQTSCAYTPQQNGVVERKHRHLLETARALSLQAKLPLKFWGDSILCATYLINRMPLQSIANQTPYFRLYGSLPTYDDLRVYGCLCYVSTLKVNRSKFEPRATACVFLGYSNSQKGYRIYDLRTNTESVSRDVVFHESIFPFHMIADTSKSDFLNSTFLPKFSSSVPSVDTPVEPPNTNHHTSHESQNNSDSTHNEHESQQHDNSHCEQHDSQINDPPVRQSSRSKHPPTYLTDYYCNLATHTEFPIDHWCNLVDGTCLPPSHFTFLSQQSVIAEPTSYSEAAANPIWVAAMEKELTALEHNKTWDLVPLPPGKKAIGSRWVFKVKLNADGSLERCKARLVAKGFNQKPGIDFTETFSPVVKMTTVRCLLSLAASKRWKLYQLDVNNAFLHGDLLEEVYMTVPEGVPNPYNLVCRLRKSLYGLRQASRQWFDKLTDTLLLQGYTQSRNDYSLFIYKHGTDITILAVYVDDIILTGSNLEHIQSVKQDLHDKFSIKDLGVLHYFLGIEVTYFTDGIVMSQNKFTKELLQGCNMDLSKRAVTPLPIHLKLHADDGDLLSDPETYRSHVGKLNFLTNTRPDLSYTVQCLSQFMQNPRTSHLQALHHTLRYISSTAGQGIKLQGPEKLTLQAFSDSDWASCPNTRRSVTGYVLLLGGSPISWKSKKQSTVSKSSSEAEYRAMAAAASEVTWVVRLLEEIGVSGLSPVTLHCDNQSALHIAKNPVFHERTKHIEVDCHFTRDKVLEGLLQLSYLPTKHQLADILTKIVPSPQLQDLCSKLGLSDSQIPPNLREAIGSIS